MRPRCWDSLTAACEPDADACDWMEAGSLINAYIYNNNHIQYIYIYISRPCIDPIYTPCQSDEILRRPLQSTALSFVGSRNIPFAKKPRKSPNVGPLPRGFLSLMLLVFTFFSSKGFGLGFKVGLGLGLRFGFFL